MTYRALQVSRGEPADVRFVDRDDVVPGDGEVLVAVTIRSSTSRMRSRFTGRGGRADRSLVPGIDVAGVVLASRDPRWGERRGGAHRSRAGRDAGWRVRGGARSSRETRSSPSRTDRLRRVAAIGTAGSPPLRPCSPSSTSASRTVRSSSPGRPAESARSRSRCWRHPVARSPHQHWTPMVAVSS